MTQVDDNGNDTISIDEWLEFWRNVLAQVNLASHHKPHTKPHTNPKEPSPLLALELRDRRCIVAWLPSYDLCTCYPRRIATRQRT